MNTAGSRASLNEAGSTLSGPLFSYRYRADGLLSAVSTTNYRIPSLNYFYGDNGLLTSKSNLFRTQTINTRDATGRILQETAAVNGTNAMVENQTWRDDGTLNSYAVTHTGAGAWNESRSYGYNSRGQVTSEDFSPSPAASASLAYTFDGGTAGLGVRTDAKVGSGASAAWQSSATTINTLSRVTADQTNALGRDIPTNGVSLGANYVELVVDGASKGKATYPGWADNVGAWSKTLTLDAGVHTLTANAVHPSGHYTAMANATFTVNVAAVTLTTAYDADGNVSSRSWSNGTTQLLTWDAFNRLIKVSQRDTSNNGYDWTAVYDGLGRRLKTTQQVIAANVASGSPTVTTSIYDPMVEFLEIGVAVNGAKAWKLHGNDLNGRFGGLNGTGGLEATILDADGTAKGVLSDAFGNGVASVTGTTVTWFPTRVGAYGPLPNIRAEVLTDITRLAEASAWRSRRIDPTGFYGIGARAYDPVTARWLSPDPLGHAASMSLYDYCSGDGVNRFDSDGRFGKDLNGNPYPVNPNNAQFVQGPSDTSLALQGMWDAALYLTRYLGYHLTWGPDSPMQPPAPPLGLFSDKDFPYLNPYQKGARLTTVGLSELSLFGGPAGEINQVEKSYIISGDTIQFDASQARLINPPSRSSGFGTGDETLATLNEQNQVVVTEGKHRLNLTLEGKTFAESVPGKPGWLEYQFDTTIAPPPGTATYPAGTWAPPLNKTPPLQNPLNPLDGLPGY